MSEEKQDKPSCLHLLMPTIPQPCPNDRAPLETVSRDGRRVSRGHHYKYPVTYGAQLNLPTHTVALQIWLQTRGQDKLLFWLSLPDEGCS